MNTQRWKKALLVGLCMLVLLVAMQHSAAAATRSSRIIGSNFLADLYDAGVGVYIPILAVFAVILFVINYLSGYVEMGAGLCKLFVCILILAGGVTALVDMIGGNIAQGATLTPPAVEWHDATPLP